MPVLSSVGCAVLALTVCGGPTGGPPVVPPGDRATADAGERTPVPFSLGEIEGAWPSQPKVVDVADGALGWTGTWRDLSLFRWYSPAFRVATEAAGGTRTGRATLRWHPHPIPGDGRYLLTTAAVPVSVAGIAAVRGSGAAESGTDARATVSLHVVATIGGRTIHDARVEVASDATGSGGHTTAFARELALPTGLEFTARAGELLGFDVALEVATSAAAGASADVAITRFSLPASTVDDALVVVERTAPRGLVAER